MDWRQRLETWPGDADADVRAGTRSGVTDSFGLAEIPELDSGATWDGSMLWVRTPGRQTAWLALPDGENPSMGVREMRVPKGTDVEVTVLAMDGKPVAGAIVTERAYLGDWPVLGEEERSARQFEFLPRVSAVTNARGVAVVPVFPGKAWLQATLNDVSSSAWAGIGPRHVTLRLVSSCEVEGRVVDDNGVGVPARGAVSCQLRRGFDGVFITLAPVRVGGAFGPVRLPLDSDDGFIFQYFGGEFEAAQVLLAAPGRGSRSFVEIKTHPGLGVPLRVTNEEGQPLANVKVATQWTRNNEWRRVDRRTDSDGRALLANLPTGEVWVNLRNPGYVPELRKLDFTEDWVRYPLEVKMRRAATVEGVATFDGRPVSTFTVSFWQAQPTDGGMVRVEGSEDGAFKIEEAAPGLVQLFASSNDVAQSAIASLTVDAGAIGKVHVELPKPRTVTGQVVDASTGEPIPSAKISVMLIVGTRALRQWKTAYQVDAQGRFEIRGMGSVQGYFSIGADGFAARGLSVWASEGPATDLGAIALHRAQSLSVRLRSSSQADFASYRVTLSSTTKYLPGVQVPADGNLRFDDLAPGLVQLRLEAIDGSTMQREVRIRPGGSGTCEFDLDGEPLDIVIVPPGGSSLPAVLDLGIRYRNRQGEEVSKWFTVPKSGVVSVDRIEATRVLLESWAENRTRLGSGEFEIPSKAPRSIRFEMKAKPARLRVVDPAHIPIVGATLILTNRSAEGDGGVQRATDEHGEVLITDVGPGEVFASVVAAEHGVLPCVPLKLAEAHGSALELMLPRGNDVQVELRDGQSSLAAVELELQDSCGSSMTFGRSLSGPDGHVQLTHLAPGDYRILVDHPGIWRTEQPITVTPTSTNFTVQLRRLGSARIRATTGGGNPVDGASVELVDVATGARVADWIEKGEVGAPANGLRTDASGTLVIHGLPRGTYRCVLTTPSGATLERMLEVPPQATGELECVLQ